MCAHRRKSCRFLFCMAVVYALTPGAAGARSSVRDPILAGTWYPGDPEALRLAVVSYILGEGTETGPPAGASPVAIIVPHAGYVYSGAIAGKGYAAVRGRKYQRVIVLGPSHRTAFDGAALPDEKAWRTPLGEVPLDVKALIALALRPGFARLPAAHAQEHCLEIQLPFLQTALTPGFRLIPIVIGQLSPEDCGEIADGLKDLLGPGTLLVISSDFTHYGPNYDYVPFREKIPERIKEVDDQAAAAIRALSPTDFEAACSRTGATICGREPIRVLLTLLQGGRTRVETLGYARSGDLMGDFTNSVSYFAFAFSPSDGGGGGGSTGPGSNEGAGAAPPGPRKLDADEGAFLLGLARETIAAALNGTKAPPAEIPARFDKGSPLREVRGVFVTLTEDGDLRGCIGSIVGEEPLVKGVSHQAINSAFHDPRFAKLRREELDHVEIEISVLTPPVSIPSYEAIEVGRHGVLIEKHGNRAVFLPQVAPEQGWDRDTMLRYLCRKAGLEPDDWKSGANFEVFEAQILEETHKN
jgi:MEMO1 family protein